MTKELMVGLFKSYKEMHEKLRSLIEEYNYKLSDNLPSDMKALITKVIVADLEVKLRMNELSRVALEKYGIILHY